jgi:tape measure domain-containing protein|tara:strand:- start:1661 stop:3655 length:1995 start_codon:yes stop_codon:yes gene_type:complete
MARASVELIVEAAKAVNPLRRVEQESKKVEQALKKNQKAARDVQAAFQRMGRTGIRSFRDLEANAARLGKRMGGLRGNIGKAAIAFAAFRAVQTGVQRVESERRIKLLSQRFGEYTQLQEAATKAAQKFNLSQTEANQALANAFARLRPLGVSLEDITSTFGGFRTAAVLGGATAAEASAAFTQLSQALGSGALRGDEFRSVAEQAPLVLQAISDETGVAAGDLKEYAAQGLLTSDIVIKALKRIESEGAGRLAQALDGPAAKIKAFQNATEDVQVALTEAVVPELAKSFVILAGIIDDLKPVIQGVGSFAAKVLGGIASTIERIRDPKKLASEARTDQARKLMAKGISLRRLTGSGMSNIPAISKADEAALFGAKPTPLPTGTTPLPKPPSKADSEADKEADRLKKIAKASADRVRSLKQQTLLSAALTDEERTQFERQIQIADILENKQGLSKTQLETELQATVALFEQQDATKAITDENKRQADAKAKAQAAEKKRIEELHNIYQGIGDTIADGVVNALKGAVTGTQSLAEAATNLLDDLANQLLQVARNMLFFGNLTGTLTKGSGIMGSIFGGFMANGGTTMAGKSYIVGEKGPELFTPGVSGTVTPNNALGGSNIVVNVDASGSSVEGDAQQSKALGQAIGAAVQAEIVKQKMPGGLLN